MTDSQTALGLGGLGVTEHSFIRRVPGEVAFVRQGIIDALESFNYVVLSENPLQAKRAGGYSMNVLNCALKLFITFRQSSPTSTTAAFNYSIPLSMLTKGDLQTVEREAEALIAIATRRQPASTCVMCGTANGEESRFCRVCGAPSVGSLPAEIEVMRLTAGARAGHQTIVSGLLIILPVLAIALALIFFGSGKREKFGWVLLILGQLIGWATLLYGIFRLHRTLNSTSTKQHFTPPDDPKSIPNFESPALPPQSAWASITEGTTELLESQEEVERRVTHVERDPLDTGSMS